MADVEARWAAEEKKLQAAYEDLSLGRYKPAQSVIDRHLRKQPKSQPALVLRMALLERTGQSDNAVLAAFDAIKETGNLTSRSGWLIGITLRNIHRLDLSMDMYRSFWEKQPDRLDLAEQVFLHAAAAWNVEEMLRSSRKMFNMIKNPVWARVAAWSEWVAKAPQPTPDEPFPEKAPKGAMLVSKTLLSTTPPGCASSDILWLRMHILLSAGEDAEAVELAQEEGREGSLARMWYRMEGVKVGLERMKRKQEDVMPFWETEWAWADERLRSDIECQRNYAFYRHFLTATQHLSSHTSKTIETLKQLHSEMGEKERAPLLARLELDKNLRQCGAGGQLEETEWTRCLLEYWGRWGSKGCIVSELEGIMGDRNAAVVMIMEEKRTGAHTDLQAYREVVNAELMCLRNRSSEWRAANEDVKRLWSLYLAGLQYGRNLPRTDVQSADDIGLAAVFLLITLWHEQSDDQVLLKAVLCLRYMTSKSPSCAQAHFLLLKLYRLVGAASLIATPLKELDATEVQCDNLLHPYFERGAADAFISQTDGAWVQQAAKAEKMYRRTATDMPEYVKQAVEHESYPKIHGIRGLKNTLGRSTCGAIMRVEKSRLAFLSSTPLSDRALANLARSVELAKKGELIDTRNWELMPELGEIRGKLQDMLLLDVRPGNEWVKAVGGMVLALERFGRGQEVDFDFDKGLGMRSSENALVRAVESVLRKAVAVTSGVEDVANGNAPSLDTIVGGLAQALSDDSKTRWAVGYDTSLLVEFDRILDHVITRLDEVTRPSGTGKNKKKPLARVGELAMELRGTRKQLGERAKVAVQRLDRLRKADDSIEWSVIGDLLEDEAFVDSAGKTTSEARSETIKNLKALLLGKKL